MSLIVETGAIVANAESLTSVADASAYHLARGNSTWAGLTTAQMEEALRRGTDYMEQVYRSRWRGWRVNGTQVLSWPRANVEIRDTPYRTLVATTVVPTEVQNACAELALRAAGADLAPDLTRGKASVTIGPITTVYDKADPQYTRFRAIDSILRVYLDSSPNNVRVVAR